MSEYQVIARKWRPQSFGDVVGQEHVVRTLRNAINSGRIAHAYLFVGPRGIGKTTLARIFAKALNCENPVNGEPCCKCSSCLELAAEKNLDVMEIDAASRNTTTDMRELAENALTRPVSGKYKIYIIDEVHMLSKQAWNVLLKTVEEPPAHVKFIFATTEVHQVLPTIISRCQRFDLMPIPTKLIAQRLQLIADTEKVAIKPEAVNAIARAAEGGMRDAQSLLDQMIAFFAAGDGSQITEDQVLSLFGLTDRNDLMAILQAILKNNPGEVVTRIANLARRGKNLETLFDDILYSLRAIQLCTILADPSDMIDESPENIAIYRSLAQQAPRDTISILLENVAPVGRVLHDALNKQVYLETVLLKAMREAHAVRIGDILARLNQLRSAGELKFLEQLPPVEKNLLTAVVPVEAPSVSMSTDESRTIGNASAVPEDVPVAVLDKKSDSISNDSVAAENGIDTPQDEVNDGVVEDNAEITATEEKVSDNISEEDAAEVAAAIPVMQETEPENMAVTAVSESSCEEIIEESEVDYTVETEEKSSPDACIPAAQSVYEETGIVVDDYDEDNGEDDLDIIEKSYNIFSSSVSAEEKKESLAPDKLQRSIANEDPQALVNVTKNNPVVQEMLDLFQGSVIDIHR